MDEGYDLALLIGQACPNSEKVAFGLNELIMNGVEHGNLQIGYDEKTQLQETNQWEEEIARRQMMEEHIHKFVEVIFERHANQIRLTVIDQGAGFDWVEYQEIRADRIMESHGRGIAMATALSFDYLNYQGNGNQVVCLINLEESVASQRDVGPELMGKIR
jgi:anti-sigma regulatory factor (Ser/Thr protein kinase)